MAVHRRERVEELLKSYIGSFLLQDDDARDLLITITAVEITRDLKIATVYWCQSGAHAQEVPDPQCQLCLEAITPEMKRGIARELQLRFVPSLKFQFDKTPFMSERIESLLKG